jgi:hypothetical protein
VVKSLNPIAGPYDELMLIPGYFDSPGLGKSPRITTIYVSTEASVRNGRWIVLYSTSTHLLMIVGSDRRNWASTSTFLPSHRLHIHDTHLAQFPSIWRTSPLNIVHAGAHMLLSPCLVPVVHSLQPTSSQHALCLPCLSRNTFPCPSLFNHPSPSLRTRAACSSAVPTG